jgi:hypothetical protein
LLPYKEKDSQIIGGENEKDDNVISFVNNNEFAFAKPLCKVDDDTLG